MPLQQMQLYQVNFDLPDGEHIMAVHSISIRTSGDAAFVREKITKLVKVNPDANNIRIKAVRDPEEIEKAAKELHEANPDRILADDLGLDTANRLLTDPSIARNLGAAQTPG